MDLPNEVFLMIATEFQDRGTNTLTKLARVSPRMQDIARVPLYAHVTIGGSYAVRNPDILQLALLLRTLIETPKLATDIRVLRVEASATEFTNSYPKRAHVALEQLWEDDCLSRIKCVVDFFSWCQDQIVARRNLALPQYSMPGVTLTQATHHREVFFTAGSREVSSDSLALLGLLLALTTKVGHLKLEVSNSWAPARRERSFVKDFIRWLTWSDNIMLNPVRQRLIDLSCVTELTVNARNLDVLALGLPCLRTLRVGQPHHS
jgi:hypothetical protein